MSKMKKPAIKKKWILAGCLVLAAGTAAFLGLRARSGRKKIAAVVTSNVRSYEAKTGTIENTVSGTGTLAAADTLDMDLLSLVTVDEVYVSAGDHVLTNDILAKVDTLSILSALESVQNQIAALDEKLEDWDEDDVEVVDISEYSAVAADADLDEIEDMLAKVEYKKMIAQRQELVDVLLQLSALYKDPNLYSPMDGTIQSVNCGDAREAELPGSGTAAKAAATGMSVATRGTSSGSNSVALMSTGSDVGTASGATAASGAHTVSVMSTGKAHGVSTMSMVGSPGESPEGDSAGESSADPGEDPTEGSSDDSSGGSSADSAEDPSDEPSSEPAEDPSREDPAAHTISSLDFLTIAEPVTGAAIPTEFTFSPDTPVTAVIRWTPAGSTFAAGTVYTATVELTADEGYVFDEKIFSDEAAIAAGKLTIANGKGQTAVNQAKIEKDGRRLTLSIIYKETEKSQDGSQNGGQNGTPAGNLPSGSSGTRTGSISLGSYSASGSSSSASESKTESLTGLSAETAVFTISSDARMQVSMTVDELDILSLSVGQKAAVTVDAADGETFDGTITEVQTSGGSSGSGVTKYTAVIEMDRTDRMLAGMNASVVVTISAAENVLMIPEAALQERGNRITVYTEYDETTQVLGGEVEVTCGASDGTSVEILSGLSQGDTVYYSYSDNSSDRFGGFGDMGGMGGMSGGFPGGSSDFTPPSGGGSGFTPPGGSSSRSSFSGGPSGGGRPGQ